jgi:uncharacterized protein YsxB (DUF464 family)
MIRIRARTRDGLLQQITFSGHGLGSPGASPSCAAVSAVAKGLGLTLVRSGKCTVSGGAPEAGYVSLSIENVSDPLWVNGVWDLTKVTLQEIQQQWPADVALVLEDQSSIEAG